MSERPFSCATAVAIAEAVRPWLDQDSDEPPSAESIVAALRAAEAEHAGGVRDLWGHAAGNAACAVAASDDISTRWLLAVALDYTRLAVKVGA